MRTWAGADFDPAHFDVDEVNGALSSRGGLRAPAFDPDSPLGDLLARIHIPLSVAEALDAMAAPPPTVDPTELRQFGDRYRWLLDRIGDDGVKLTAAGYLPPLLVNEIAVALGLDDLWIGTANREHHTIPVLQFRESTQDLRLLRRSKGYLMLTKAGQRVRDDPDFLWRHRRGAADQPDGAGSARRGRAACRGAVPARGRVRPTQERPGAPGRRRPGRRGMA